jgi:hypothetical protein
MAVNIQQDTPNEARAYTFAIQLGRLHPAEIARRQDSLKSHNGNFS